MNIIILSTAYPLRGGIAHFIELLAQHLKLRHSTKVFTFSRQYPKLLFPGKSQEEQYAAPNTEAAEQIIDSINPFNWIKVGKKMKNLRPDILIFKYWMPFFAPCFGVISWFARRNGHTKVLYICDNIIPHERRPGDVLLTKFAFSQVDYAVVQSNSVEQDLKKYFSDIPYAKLVHPVYENFGERVSKSEARSKLGIEPDCKVILFFGYIRRYKGLHSLLESMALLPKEMNIRLLVAGEFYEKQDEYRELIARLKLGDRVIIHSDYIPTSEVAKYFSAADCVVLPYRSATQSGIVQIAYNFDKPVIATDVGGLSEVVLDGKTGFIVSPDDPLALKEAIVRFYREEKEEEFSRHVVQQKKNYSWDAFVNGIEKLVTQPDRE